jgi:hypothetical protein
MASNVRNPILLEIICPVTVETVTKGVAAVAEAHLGYTRAGVFPSAAGGYVAGICTKSVPATDRAMPVATTGYAIVRVKPAAVITLDGGVSIDTTGEAIPAAAGYVVGRALDSSTGSGTALVPHFIRIKLN